MIKGTRSLVDVCREFDLKQSEVKASTETFLKCGKKGLKANAEDEQAVKESEIKELRAKFGSIPRSTFYYGPKLQQTRKPKLAEALVEMIHGIDRLPEI